MSKKGKLTPSKILLLPVTLFFIFCFILFLIVRHHTIALLSPAGQIAQSELSLMKFAALLSLIVIIPVFGILFYIIFTFRESKKSKKYAPEYSNVLLELIWWAIPLGIITILSIVTWNKTHQLDPFKSLSSNQTPVRIQAVAMNWKWLFIYPDYGIASVNELTIPTNHPIDFSITSEGTMNSLWIPQLGGQIYAMAGMNTQLHLIASKPGIYRGGSANISGSGFAGMHFNVSAVDTHSFSIWASSMTSQPQTLTKDTLRQLAEPSEDVQPFVFGTVENGIYDRIVNQYMPFQPDPDNVKTNKVNGMNMSSMGGI